MCCAVSCIFISYCSWNSSGLFVLLSFLDVNKSIYVWVTNIIEVTEGTTLCPYGLSCASMNWPVIDFVFDIPHIQTKSRFYALNNVYKEIYFWMSIHKIHKEKKVWSFFMHTFSVLETGSFRFYFCFLFCFVFFFFHCISWCNSTYTFLENDFNGMSW